MPKGFHLDCAILPLACGASQRQARDLGALVHKVRYICLPQRAHPLSHTNAQMTHDPQLMHTLHALAITSLALEDADPLSPMRPHSMTAHQEQEVLRIVQFLGIRATDEIVRKVRLYLWSLDETTSAFCPGCLLSPRHLCSPCKADIRVEQFMVPCC